MTKKKNTMIIGIIGQMVKILRRVKVKVIYYPFGDFLMKNKERKT